MSKKDSNGFDVAASYGLPDCIHEEPSFTSNIIIQSHKGFGQIEG